MTITVLWVMASCSVVGWYPEDWGTTFFQNVGTKHQTTQCPIPRDSNPHIKIVSFHTSQIKFNTMGMRQVLKCVPML
jgi:hypothetical protein